MRTLHNQSRSCFLFSTAFSISPITFMYAQQSVRPSVLISTRIIAAPSVWIYVKLSTGDFYEICPYTQNLVNPLNTELNPICYLLALLGAHHFLHVSRIRVKLLTLRRLMLYIYGAPILDVSRSHTTTHHSR